MINNAMYLIKRGLIKAPYYFNLILGNIACAQANMLNMGLMIKELPEDSLWSAGGIGDKQITMNAMALVAGEVCVWVSKIISGMTKKGHIWHRIKC